MGSNNLNQNNLNQENLRQSMNYVKKNNYWNSHHHEILKSLLSILINCTKNIKNRI